MLKTKSVALVNKMVKHINGLKNLKSRYSEWRIKQKSKLNPIRRDSNKYENNIFSNSLLRIVASILCFLLIIYFLFSIGSTIEQSSNNWYTTVFGIILFTAIFYFPAKFIWSTYNQLSLELEINKTIRFLKWNIKKLSEPSEKKNYRSLQGNITELRNSIVGYLDNSLIIGLPVSNFELNRLKKRIDIFTNCASEALVPINEVFSQIDKYESDCFQDYQEYYEKERAKESLDEKNFRKDTGYFQNFDLPAMDEFLDNLWNVLFEKEVRRYYPLAYKHSVNLILLSRFFAKWNSRISDCQNCKELYEKNKADIEEYYKSVSELEGENRQRKWKLRDDAIIVVVSVALSTLIQHFL